MRQDKDNHGQIGMLTTMTVQIPELSEETKRASLYQTLQDLPAGDPWIFGYGSLMWNPGFNFKEQVPAVAYGFHRAFCVSSFHYRGTPQKPGLVLGLDRGGSCRGLAFNIQRADAEQVLSYLWQREMTTGIYTPRFIRLHMLTGDRPYISGLTFVANSQHPQYTGDLSLADMAKRISEACGQSGDCHDYLTRTVDHLDQLGIPDGSVHRILREVKSYRAKQKN